MQLCAHSCKQGSAGCLAMLAPSVSRHSGARYQRVEMYSVYGCRLCMLRQLPKSASFRRSPLMRMFSGLMSLRRMCSRRWYIQ